MSRIGIFDSGLGGYHIYHSIKEAYPKQDIVFFADQANVPYGNKSKEELQQIFAQNMRFFRSQKIRTVIIGCNTMSSMHPQVEGMRLVNIIDVTAKEVHAKKLLVLATCFTANSHAYRDALPSSEVIEIGFENLARLIEEGASDEAIYEEIDSKLSAYKGSHIPALLACTHYPLVKDIIEDYLQAETYDSANAVIKEKIYTEGEGTSVFFASGDTEKFDEKVERIFKEHIQSERVRGEADVLCCNK